MGNGLSSKLLNREYAVFWRLLAYLKNYKKRFFAALGCMVIFGATDGFLPYILKRVLDDVFNSQDKDVLPYVFIVIVGFAIVRGTFGFFQRYLIAGVGLSIIKDLRNDIYKHLLNLPTSFYSKHSTGSLISRITNDALLVRVALTDAAAALLRDSIRIVALLIAAFYLDPILSLVAFIGFPLAFYPIIKFGRKVRKLSRVGQDQLGGLTAILQESIIGQKVVKSFAMEDREQEKFENENQIVTKTYKKAEKYGALTSPINEVIGSIVIGMTVIYGGFTVISGIRTQGDFIAFITTMFLLYEPIKKLGRVNNVIQTGSGAAERIFEVLDQENTVPEKEEAKDLIVERGQIKYNKVFFNYLQAEDSQEAQPKWNLENINLSIEPGQTLALVGMSGGGKSTIVDLLSRFYDPQSGEILIDSQNIKDVSLSSLRSSIAVVTQHTFLFNASIAENIAYGKESATREEIERAAKAAYADEFIKNLPDSYDTVIGEQGLRLSGGERARIAIARALLKDAPILILDEATASLDSESEDLVQGAIEELMKGRTSIVIAHRLATVRNATKIAVVINGKVVETGKHIELLEKNGDYSKLYRLQFKETTTKAQVIN